MTRSNGLVHDNKGYQKPDSADWQPRVFELHPANWLSRPEQHTRARGYSESSSSLSASASQVRKVSADLRTFLLVARSMYFLLALVPHLVMTSSGRISSLYRIARIFEVWS